MVKRNGHGEGSIRRRTTDGRWEGRLRHNGKRSYFYGSTRESVHKQLIDAKGSIFLGLDISKRIAFSEAATEWLSVKKLSVTEGTYNKYFIAVTKHLNPHFSTKDVVKINSADVEMFYANLIKKGLSASYISTVIHACLSNIFQLCVKHELTLKNPSSLANKPKVRQEQKPMWSIEETRRFLAVIKGHKYESLFHVLLGCFLRINECLALEWTDIDIKNRTISISKSLKRKANGSIFSEFPRLKTQYE